LSILKLIVERLLLLLKSLLLQLPYRRFVLLIRKEPQITHKWKKIHVE
jgi:hypothetical protein